MFPDAGSSPQLLGESVVVLAVGGAVPDVEHLDAIVRRIESFSAAVAGDPQEGAPLVGLGVFPNASAYQHWIGRWGTGSCFKKNSGCAAVAFGDEYTAAVAHEVSHGMQWRCRWPRGDPVWVVWWEEGWAAYAEGLVGNTSAPPRAIGVLCEWTATGSLLSGEVIVPICNERQMLRVVNAARLGDEVMLAPECGTIVCAHSWLLFAFLMEHSAATKAGIRALAARYRAEAGERSLLNPRDVVELIGHDQWNTLDEELGRFLQKKRLDLEANK